MDTESLELLFRDLDKRHFRGLIASVYRIDWRNLDEPSKVESAASDGMPESIPGGIRGICIPKTGQILIDHCRSPEDQNGLRATVLHEMIHAAVEIERPLRRTDGPHGPRFLRELKRLVRAGDKCLEPQVEFYSLPWQVRLNYESLGIVGDLRELGEAVAAAMPK